MRAQPVILHLDLDAFFSAVEQLHKPSLRGKPVIVGGTGRRGVVATASYEARTFGVGSAMPVAQARRLCPNAAYLAPRFPAYQAISGVVMGLLRELSPLLEQVSIDEAYVDLSPTHPTPTLEEVTALAQTLRARVRERTGLTASVGVGTSKLVAKIGSELAKPDGLTVVMPGTEADLLAQLPIGRLPWAGPATRDVLRKRRITTVSELASTDLADVVALLGQAHGTTLHQYANGIDHRAVVTERETKSVSAEETFPVDLTNRRELQAHLRHLVERVCARLAKDGLFGRTVTVKVRHHDFSTLTRSTTLDQPTDSAATLLGEAERLLAGVDTTDGIRLLGFGVCGLRDYAQTDLLADLLADVTDPEGAVASRAGDAPEEPDAATATEAEPGADPAGKPAGKPAEKPAEHARVWLPGQDVWHASHGPGWVQGSGLGRVTVRLEGPHSPPGRILTFDIADPGLSPAPPPTW
jgi:DNA polymerase-4